MYKHNGYVYVKAEGHPNADKKGFYAKHRLVIEQNIGRYLRSDEHVHHRNHIRDDNRLSNLQLLTKGEHRRNHAYESGFHKHNLGKKFTEEHKKKIGLGNLGKKHSEEAKEKIRQAKLRNPVRYWLGKKRPGVGGRPKKNDKKIN